jgi:hypothetical protein
METEQVVAFIDRAALPLLVQPIKRDLQISDTLSAVR